MSNVSRPSTPDHPDPWAMQLVIHRNKHVPANHIDVLEAAGAAVVTLLDDPRSTADDGVWAAAVAHWRAGWIRKVARRAENKRWDDVQLLSGVTVSVESPEPPPEAGSRPTAAVRAFVPGPLDPLPPELKKLQVGGTQFPHDHPSHRDGAAVTIELAPGLELSTGKAAAQVGHAAQLAYEHLVNSDSDTDTDSVLSQWRADGFRIRVVEGDQAAWDAAERPVRVVDAGLTEVDGATETARAWW